MVELKKRRWKTIRVSGPAYKNGEWVRRHFLAYLERADKITRGKWDHVALEGIAAANAEEWADFCVLEGVAVAFK